MVSEPPYPVKPFPDRLLSDLKEISEKIATEVKNPIAAYDADGTLWRTDIGEVFLEYQIQNCDFQWSKNQMSDYLEFREKDPLNALFWLAKINSGIELKTLQKWARDCFQKYETPLFEPMKHLIEFQKNLGFEILIVTASVKWAVEPFAKLFGLNSDAVIGTTAKIEDGLITEELDELTFKEGKATALKNRNKIPAFASGNTISDLDLLMLATHTQLAVQSEPKGRLFESEQKLKDIALQKGWLAHSFF